MSEARARGAAEPEGDGEAARELPPSPWARYGWAMSAIWLVFLAFPASALIAGERPWWLRILGLLLLVSFAAVYLHAFLREPTAAGSRHLEGFALLHLAVMVAHTAVLLLLEGGAGLGTLPYLAALAVFTLRPWWVVLVVAACVALPLVAPFAGVAEPGDRVLALIVLGVAAVTSIVRFIDTRDDAWRRTRRDYDIVAERERVARDVHDVLGHSLTVLAVKAELAERVLDTDPERTRDELRQIQSLTRESMAEIRATVAGLRVARLGDELQSARRVLDAVGIDADVPTATDAVDPRHRLVLAWVLREAVTNVVRHSGADRCEVVLSADGLRVVDDGRGVDDVPEGNGLRGVRERVRAAGGTIEVGPGPGGHGTMLEVCL